MSRFKLPEGRLVRQLLILFVVLGIVPAILLTGLPAAYQWRTSRKAVAMTELELEHQAEVSLLRSGQLTAARYGSIFSEKAREAQMLANQASQALTDPVVEGTMPWSQVNFETWPGGWSASPPDSPYGLLISPLAMLGEDAISRQQSLSTLVPAMQSIVDVDPTIRSTFITTEDQTIWLIPNDFWADDGSLNIASASDMDLTTRPYYRETREVIWSNPYVDMEPVVTIAAPIWIEDDFYGMAGLDFSISVIVQELLETDISGGGAVFLIGESGELVAVSEQVKTLLFEPAYQGTTDIVLDQSLFDAVSTDVNSQFRRGGLEERLQGETAFNMTLDLPTGPTYFVVAPMQDLPWSIGMIRPVAEATQITTELTTDLQQAAVTWFRLSMISGAGFLLVVLIGGLITLHRLALPIQELAHGAAALTSGNLTYRVPVGERNDELNDLSAEFNVMAEAIQIARDDFKRQQEELRQTLTAREQELAIINQVAALANQPVELSTRLRQALEIAHGALGTDVLILSLLDNDGQLNLAAYACSECYRETIVKRFAVIAKHTLTHRAIETEDVVSIHDVQGEDSEVDAEERSFFEEMDARRIALKPIVARGRVLGVLTMMRHSAQPIENMERRIVLLDALTEQFAILIENANLQSQTRELSIIKERRWLASELHDSVTQSVFTLNLTVKGLRAMLGDDAPAEFRQAFEMLDDQIGVVQREMRTLIDELRPVDLQRERLDNELKRHANSLRRSAKIKVDLSIKGDIHQLPRSVQQHFNRIAQEALSNVARHAGAQHANIALTIEPDAARLLIADDGQGFDIQTTARRETGSLGLLSMRERAEMVGGALIIRSIPGEGTTLVATVPLSQEAITS